MTSPISFGSLYKTSSNASVAQKQQDVQKYQGEVNTYSQQSSLVSSDIFTKSSETNNQSKVQDAQTAINDAQTAMSNAQNAVSDAQSAVSDAQSALSAAQAIPVKTITNEDGTTTEDSSERDAAIAAAEAQVAEAESQLESANQELENAQQQLENAQQQLEAAEKEEEISDDDIEEMEKKLEEIEDKLDEAETNLDTAETELEKAEKAVKDDDEEKEQGWSKNVLNPFSSFLDESPLENLFKIDKVSEDESKELAEKAVVLLNKDSFSEKDVKDAEKYVDKINLKKYDAKSEDVKNYVELASDIKDLIKNKTEEKTQEVKEDLYDVFTTLNVKNGTAPEVTNALKLAYNDIGLKEATGNNDGEILKYQGRKGDPWCASFVSWIYGDGQDNNKNNNTFGYQAAVRMIRKEAEKTGHYASKDSYQPVPGDIMIQEEKGASHTGMVVKTDKDYVYTIEGNAGDAVRAKKYSIDGECYGKISGYVKMNEWNGSATNPIAYDILPDDKYEDADKDKKQSTL